MIGFIVWQINASYDSVCEQMELNKDTLRLPFKPEFNGLNVNFSDSLR